MDSLTLFIRLRHFAFKCHILSSVFQSKHFGIERFYFREVINKKMMYPQARLKNRLKSCIVQMQRIACFILK